MATLLSDLLILNVDRRHIFLHYRFYVEVQLHPLYV